MTSKHDLRLAARQRRRALIQPGFAQAIARFAAELGIGTDRVVGGYHALAEEADPAGLIQQLMGCGCQIAYPRVVARDMPLEFYRVPDGQVMAAGAYGISEPLKSWPQVIPDLLLVPLLAFDAHGNRLGYGGGYYDRTIASLHVPAIGIAYAGQEVASLPRGPHDMALDMVITEQGIRRWR